MNDLFNSDVLVPAATVLTLLSIATLLLSLFLIPWFVGILHRDYFLRMTTPSDDATENKKTIPFRSLSLLLIRNLVGLVLLLAGIAMLFLPGQGLLTIFASLVLLTFPGKRALICSLTRKTSVRRSLDWLRRRQGKQPFSWPD